MQKETGFNPYPPEETLPADALAHYERNAAGLYLVHLSEFYDEVDQIKNRKLLKSLCC